MPFRTASVGGNSASHWKQILPELAFSDFDDVHILQCAESLILPCDWVQGFGNFSVSSDWMAMKHSNTVSIDFSVSTE